LLLTLSLAARAGKKLPITEGVISKWSLPIKFEKICNPSLLSMNYFVLSNLLSKMSSYVSFFITSLKNLNFEGSYALHKKPSRRSKIRKKTYFGNSGRHQVHVNFQPSPPSTHVATHAKVSTATPAKNYL
jgi:hypothetical protein